MTASAPRSRSLDLGSETGPHAVAAQEGWFAVIAWPIVGEGESRQEVGRYAVLAWLLPHGDGHGDALVYDPAPGVPALLTVSALAASSDGRLLRYEHERWAARPAS